MYAMIGLPGGGKSTMACALVNAFVQKGRRARYVCALSYINAIRSSWNQNSLKKQFEIEREYATADLVVVDELTRRADTQSENALLLDMLGQRYDRRRSTVLIANVATAQELQAQVDARLIDRIRDDAGGVILCNWPSIRGRLKTDE